MLGVDCTEMYPSIFGAEIHTLGRSAPECFPDTDPVMVCSRVTFPVPENRIAAMCLQRHPCQELKFWKDIYVRSREQGMGKVWGELTAALPISKTYLDTRREQCWSGEKFRRSAIGKWQGPDPSQYVTQLNHGVCSLRFTRRASAK